VGQLRRLRRDLGGGGLVVARGSREGSSCTSGAGAHQPMHSGAERHTQRIVTRGLEREEGGGRVGSNKKSQAQSKSVIS
jgi:hypothetical protein